MKVSIIVPIYNVEKYLRKCLDSLVAQTLNEIEIILVNDGSKDDSKKIMKEYKNNYPDKIICIYKENGGQGSARNEGLKVAKGKYIAYVDSDDWIDEKMIETMYNKAEKANYDILVCGTKVVNEKYEILQEEPAIMYEENIKNLLFGKMAIWNKIYRREILEKENYVFRTKKWYEDLDFTAKIILEDYNIGFIDENFYYYVERPNSTMNNQNARKNLEILDAMNEIIKYYKNVDKYEKSYQEIEFLAIYHIYITTIVRVIMIDEVDRKEKYKIISQLSYYMNNNFPLYTKNKYNKDMNINRKIVFILLKFKLYRVIKILLSMKRRRRK